ncbi:hypothetical protein CEXT_295101 [Caerostris extrusa]|uniref:Uncharacterized protein n=1 Tax=Caerostris extrusa TaxID=172846 RepID=A0AAV4WR48_CAEEX|nr:hypothetical protein CEXT_295101 [Caerostris extrusa]
MEKCRRVELYNPLEIRFRDSCFSSSVFKVSSVRLDILQIAFSNNDALQVVGKAALPTGGVFLLKKKKARHLIAEYILRKIKRKERKKRTVTYIPRE